MTRAPRRKPAQAVVEFGIVAVIFFFLIMGVVDFGMTMNAWLTVSTASRDAARQAAIGAKPGDVRALVQKIPFPGVDRAAGPVEVNIWVRTACPSGCKVTNSGGDVWTLITGTTDYSSATYSTSKYPDGTDIPAQGDQIRVEVRAAYFELITPAVRAAFGCAGSLPKCYVPLSSQTIVRYEGVYIQ